MVALGQRERIEAVGIGGRSHTRGLVPNGSVDKRLAVRVAHKAVQRVPCSGCGGWLRRARRDTALSLTEYHILAFHSIVDTRTCKQRTQGLVERQMFERRAIQGQCFTQPYLGTREFSAAFRLVNPEKDALCPALSAEQGGNRDLGIMLYDMDFSNPKSIQAMFYRAEMKDGVIIVPPLNSEEFCDDSKGFI